MNEQMKSWNEIKKMADELVAQLQLHRDYEEEVSYDSDFADMLTDAIDANLALMPTVLVGR